MSFIKDCQDQVAGSEWQWEPFIKRILEGDIEHFDFQVSSQEVQNSVSSWTDKDLGLDSSQESHNTFGSEDSRSGVRCTLFKGSRQMGQQESQMEEEPSELMSSQRSSKSGTTPGIQLHCGLEDSSRGSDDVKAESAGFKNPPEKEGELDADRDRFERTGGTMGALGSNSSPAVVQQHHGKFESPPMVDNKLGNREEEERSTGVDFQRSQTTVAVKQSSTLSSEDQGLDNQPTETAGSNIISHRDSTDDCDIIAAVAEDFNKATEKLRLSVTESSGSPDKSSSKKQEACCTIASNDAANCQDENDDAVTGIEAFPEEKTVHCDASASRSVDPEHLSSITVTMNKDHSVVLDNPWHPKTGKVYKLGSQLEVQAGPADKDAVLPVRNPDTDEISTDGGTDNDAADDLEDKNDATDDLEDKKNVRGHILERDSTLSKLVKSFETAEYSQHVSRNQTQEMLTDLTSEPRDLQLGGTIRTSSKEQQEQKGGEVHSTPDTIPPLDFCIVEASTGNCLYRRSSGSSTEDDNESGTCVPKADREDAPGNEDSGIVNITRQDNEMEHSDDAEFGTVLTTMSTSTPLSASSPSQLFAKSQDHNFKPLLIKSFTSDAGYCEQAGSQSPKEIGQSYLNLLKSVVMSIEDGYPTESSKDDNSQDFSEDSKSLNECSDTEDHENSASRESKSTPSDAQNPAVSTRKMEESSSQATTGHCERRDVTPRERETSFPLVKSVSDPELRNLLGDELSKEDDRGGKNKIKELIDFIKKQKQLQSKKRGPPLFRKGPVTKSVESVNCINRTRVHNHEVELRKEFSHSKSDSEKVLLDPLKEWMHSLAHVQIHCDYVPHKMLISVKEQKIKSKEAAHDYGSFSVSCEEVSCCGVPAKKSLWAPIRLMVDDDNDMLVHHTACVETPATYGFSLFHGVLLPCVLHESDKFYVYKHIEDCYIKDLSGKKRSPRWALRKFRLSSSSFLDLAGLNAEMQIMHVYMGPGNFKVIKEDSAETVCEHHKVWKTLYHDDKKRQTIKAANWAPRLPSSSVEPSEEKTVQSSLESDNASKQHDVKDASLSLLELSRSTIATHDAVPLDSVPVDLSSKDSAVCAEDQQNQPLLLETVTPQTNSNYGQDSEKMLVTADNTDESPSDLSTESNHFDTVASNKPDTKGSPTRDKTDANGSLSCQKANSATSTITSQQPSRSTSEFPESSRGQQGGGPVHTTSGEVKVVTKEANNTTTVYSSLQLTEKNPALTGLVTSPTSLPSLSSRKTLLRLPSGHYVWVCSRADPLKVKPLSCEQLLQISPKISPQAHTTSCREAVQKSLSTVSYQYPGLESSIYDSACFKPPILPRVPGMVTVQQRHVSADGTRTLVLQKAPKCDSSRSTDAVPGSSKASTQVNIKALVSQGTKSEESPVAKKKTTKKLSEGLPLPCIAMQSNLNTVLFPGTAAAPVLQQQQFPGPQASDLNHSNIATMRDEPLDLCCHKRKTHTQEKEPGEPLLKYKKAATDQPEKTTSPRQADVSSAIMVQAEACVRDAFTQAHKELQSVEKEISEVREELVQTRCERINLETRLEKLQQLAAARKNIGCRGKIRL